MATKETISLLSSVTKVLHTRIIETSGGLDGVRDEGGLEHAIGTIIDLLEKYSKDPFLYTAHVYYMLATRHYFIDGNKRTSHILAKIILLTYGKHHLKIHYQDTVDFIIKIGAGKKTINQIRNWIESNSEEVKVNHIDKYAEDWERDMNKMKG